MLTPDELDYGEWAYMYFAGTGIRKASTPWIHKVDEDGNHIFALIDLDRVGGLEVFPRVMDGVWVIETQTMAGRVNLVPVYFLPVEMAGSDRGTTWASHLYRMGLDRTRSTWEY